MKRKRLFAIVCGVTGVVGVVAFVLFSSVEGVKEMSVPQVTAIESVPESWWDELAEKKIFFGHQSVGANLIEGMKDVAADHPNIRLEFVETKDLGSVEGPGFFHGKVGTNTRPNTKVEDFKGIMGTAGGTVVDVAFLKFCYVDIRRDSDPQVIFDCYQTAITELRERFSQTTFVHVTVPIESAPVGVMNVLKERIKTVVRRPGVVEDNRVRQRYNDLLRDSYAGKEPIFDIARFESISPEGLIRYRTMGSDKVFMMVGRYTDDGGHLNKNGRRVAAEQLLIMLAEAVIDAKQW